ncbi:MAG TPA: ATP-dependent RNA helicase HrpA [Kribbellaceae bacterium]
MSDSPTLDELRRRLPALAAADRYRLGRRLERARGIRPAEKRRTTLVSLGDAITAAERTVERRHASVPAIEYPEQLPVSQLKDDIAAAIRDHQVVVVAGETGSGKTTQIPKICLELGRGVQGMIGHTQPRRLAARTVAERIAEELGTDLGSAVGYAVRFTDKVSDRTLVKLMTDGILLAELQRDRDLLRYDTLIVDEAHERSLNIDFILGYLKQLLPRRPDLKVVITSATIDPERFAEHFAAADGTPAPIVEVSGRTYPVELRYRPVVDPDDPSTLDRDQTQAILDAVDELAHEPPGDVLVFLSGEREIRDTADALRAQNLRDTEILPLYARLSAAEQHRVFQRHPGRRIVLATNVAETSLTVPGIKYVVDPGTARISRYSHRTKVQHLPIEAVSQASANQRKGRCGRTSDGICIRLYSEEDFENRPEFTDPEILRTNLASVILQMTSIGLGDIAAFPFIDEPDKRSVKDGVQLLVELGALDETQADPRKRLTGVGRQLAQLPVDPRLARMIVEADRNGCVREVMVIAAALSIQDPRERPAEAEAQATQQHARFRDPGSDFLGFLNLWNYLKQQQKELSGNQFRRMCRAEYLNYLRVREWQDIYAQLRQVASQIGVTLNTGGPADPQRVHVSLLAGLLSHIGMKDPANQHQYIGARNARFAIFPGSALFKKPPQFVMAAELVETSKLWARVNARIEPEWAEGLAEHLVKRSYSEPHWERKAGAVMAYEKVTLYGVPIVAGRKVNYGRIEPELARELFIRHALVDGDWDTRHHFFHANRKLVEEVEELEERTRRRDLLVDDETLFAFYDERIGREVVSGRHFDSWWKKTRQRDPDLLDFERSLLVREDADEVRERDYPLTWRQGGFTFDLTYAFEPGADADGVTVHIPLLVLNQVEPDGFEWSVPGFREELVTALIKSLPKQVRRGVVPAPDHARLVLPRLGEAAGSLTAAVARELRALRGAVIDESDWDWSRVPGHLRMTFRVVDDHGKTVAESKNLAELKQRLKPRTRKAISAVAAKAVSGLERSGLTGWTFGELPRSFSEQRGGLTVAGYPALVDDGTSVSIRLQETEQDQYDATWRGIRRLLLLTTPSVVDVVQRTLSNQAKMTLTHNPHRNVPDLLDDCVTAAVDALMHQHGAPVWDRAGFDALRDAVRADLAGTVLAILGQVERILAVARAVDRQISRASSPALLPVLTDVRGQLEGLVHRGFVTETGAARLPDVVRYLKGIEQRLDKVGGNVARDRQATYTVQTLTEEYERRLAAVPPGKHPSPALREVRWMLEELRVSLFAQTLGTAYPVSDKRIRKALADS